VTTPSTGGVLHTGDPTPLVVAGPTVRPDPVTAFGEAPAASGWYGVVTAAELMRCCSGTRTGRSGTDDVTTGSSGFRRGTPSCPDPLGFTAMTGTL